MPDRPARCLNAYRIGTALVMLWVGLIANRHSRRLFSDRSRLMMAIGAGSALDTDFWPLLVIAVVGAINRTSGDASIFMPLKQTVLTPTIEPWTPARLRTSESLASSRGPPEAVRLLCPSRTRPSAAARYAAKTAAPADGHHSEL